MVNPGGSAVSTFDQDQIYVASSASALDTTLIGIPFNFHGGAVLSNWGFTSGDVVGSSGLEETQSGASSLAETISSTGVASVFAGGEALGVTVLTGGSAVVAGEISGAQVLSGGLLVVSSGALALAVTVSSGGSAVLAPVVSSGQTLTVPAAGASAGVVGGVTIESGGLLEVSAATVLSGGTLSIGACAYEAGGVVSFGGTLSGPGVLGGQDLSPAETLDLGRIVGASVGDATNIGALQVGSGGVASNVTDIWGQVFVDSGGSSTVPERREASKRCKVKKRRYCPPDRLVCPGGRRWTTPPSIARETSVASRRSIRACRPGFWGARANPSD